MSVSKFLGEFSQIKSNARIKTYAIENTRFHFLVANEVNRPIVIKDFSVAVAFVAYKLTIDLSRSS